jgi:hypothetical protein
MKDDFRDKSKLSVIDGKPSRRKPYRRKHLGEPEQVTCHVCEVDTGVETSATIEMTVAPLRTPDGRKAGGTKQHVCIHCLSRGKITKLIG